MPDIEQVNVDGQVYDIRVPNGSSLSLSSLNVTDVVTITSLCAAGHQGALTVAGPSSSILMAPWAKNQSNGVARIVLETAAGKTNTTIQQSSNTNYSYQANETLIYNINGPLVLSCPQDENIYFNTGSTHAYIAHGAVGEIATTSSLNKKQNQLYLNYILIYSASGYGAPSYNGYNIYLSLICSQDCTGMGSIADLKGTLSGMIFNGGTQSNTAYIPCQGMVARGANTFASPLYLELTRGSGASLAAMKVYMEDYPSSSGSQSTLSIKDTDKIKVLGSYKLI